MVSGWVRNAVAEAFGAFVIVFSTVVVTNLGWTPRALIYGFGVAGLVAALGHVSGAHFNPAITVAMLLGKHISGLGAVIYCVAQLVGGVLGGFTVLWTTNDAVVDLGTPVIADEPVNVSVGGAIAIEAIVTMVVVLIVFGTIVDQRAPLSVYPFAIGLAITAGVMVSGPLAGGALNPVRGFGAAVAGGAWSGWPAWLIGPMVGGILAWALYHFVIVERNPGGATRRGMTFPEPMPPPPGPSLLP